MWHVVVCLQLSQFAVFSVGLDLRFVEHKRFLFEFCWWNSKRWVALWLPWGWGVNVVASSRHWISRQAIERSINCLALWSTKSLNNQYRAHRNWKQSLTSHIISINAAFPHFYRISTWSSIANFPHSHQSRERMSFGADTSSEIGGTLALSEWVLKRKRKLWCKSLWYFMRTCFIQTELIFCLDSIRLMEFSLAAYTYETSIFSF